MRRQVRQRASRLNGWVGVLILLMSGGCEVGQLVVFSPVQGRVTRGGVPIAGATVERQAHCTWTDRTSRDSAQTGRDGEFSFGALTDRSWLASILPHEPLVNQKITITHENKTYEAWILIKHNYELQGELGQPIRIFCDLEQAPKRTEVNQSALFGICRLEP